MGKRVGRRGARRQDSPAGAWSCWWPSRCCWSWPGCGCRALSVATPRSPPQLRNAGGSLRNGSDVKIAGVIVGRVTGIARGDDGGVRVDMSCPTATSTASPTTWWPGSCRPPCSARPSSTWSSTTRPPTTRSRPAPSSRPTRPQGTLELQQALDDIDRLVKALGPAELASAIGSAAQALDGRGEQLGEIVDTLTAYLGRLNPQMPLVRSDLRKLATNLEVVDDVAPDLLDATEDGLVTLNTIVTQQAAIRADHRGGTSLTSTATAFLNENRAEAGAGDRRRCDPARRRSTTTGAPASPGSIATNIALGAELPASSTTASRSADAQHAHRRPALLHRRPTGPGCRRAGRL